MRTGEDAIGPLNLPYKGRCGPSTMLVASLTRVATSAAVMMTTMIEDIAIVGERTMTITTAASDGGITIVDRAITTTAETAIGAARRMTTALNGASAIGETGAARSLRRRPPIETLVDRRAMLSRRGHRHRRRPRQSRPRLLRRVKAHSVCTVNYKHVRSLLSKIIRMHSRPSKLTIIVSPSSVPPPAHTSALAGRANR